MDLTRVICGKKVSTKMKLLISDSDSTDVVLRLQNMTNGDDNGAMGSVGLCERVGRSEK